MQIIVYETIKNFQILNEEILGASFECKGYLKKSQGNKQNVN